MATIPILGLGIQGRSPNVTAQKRLNLLLDVQPEGDKTRVAAYGTPGTTLFYSFGNLPVRGWRWMQSVNLLFVVVGGYLYEITPAVAVTNRGALASLSSFVSLSDNGTQLLIVDGSKGYVYTPGTTTFTTITDVDFPAADTCTFLDGYFIVNRINTGQFWVSDLYNGLSWNGLWYATAESNPDNLVSVVANDGLLILLGEVSIEFWQDSGALDFPFAKITGSSNEVGLASKWTLARCGGFITFLAKTRRGGYSIMRINGYQTEVISPPELAYNINHYAAPADSVAFSYVMNGKDFYQITFQADNETWLYDATVGTWSRLKTYGHERHMALFGLAFNGLVLVSDHENGNIYVLDDQVYSDNGFPIERELIGPHVWDARSLNKTIISRLRIDMEGGVGITSGQGSDPQVMLQISRDGGHTWGGELWTSLGSIGKYAQRAEWRRLGLSRDWLFKLRLTDPVKPVVIGAYAEIRTANR